VVKSQIKKLKLMGRQNLDFESGDQAF